MTIEREEKNLVRFKELTEGTVFEYEGEIYMKISNTSVVELEFGYLAVIKEDTLVKILNARLTVTE